MDERGQTVNFGVYLSRHYDLTPVGLVTRIYPRGERPSPTYLHAETERVWRAYALRGVFNGQLQNDRFLTLLALNYGTGDLARADLAYRQGFTLRLCDFGNLLSERTDFIHLRGSRAGPGEVPAGPAPGNPQNGCPRQPLKTEKAPYEQTTAITMRHPAARLYFD